jgi:hypothetical protein
MVARPTALLAAALAVSAVPLSALPAVAESALPTISFRVVEPDGSTVVSPVVVVSGMGPAYSHVHVLAGGAAGQVVVPFPTDDPVAVATLAAGDAVNVMIRVFDKQPGSADINAAYVGAAFGVDPFGTVSELSGVTGTTIALAPGRTDFHQGLPGFGTTLPLPGGDPPPPPGDCEPIAGSGYMCTKADYPTNSKHVPVPIAYNHGAGNEMVSSITYSSTNVTNTETAVQVGTGGFVEVAGTVAYSKESATTLEFADVGPADNVIALLETEFERDRTWWCAPSAGVDQCQQETLYRPYQAAGTASEPHWLLNDHMDPHNDCWEHVDGAYQPVTTSEITSSFSFTLAADEKWSETSQGTLSAKSTVTQQNHDKKSYIRRWSVAVPKDRWQYTDHYVYVPNGLNVPNPETISNSKCVATRLGNVQTAASFTNWLDPPVEEVPPPPSDPTDDEQSTEQPVCGHMPDRCD